MGSRRECRGGASEAYDGIFGSKAGVSGLGLLHDTRSSGLGCTSYPTVKECEPRAHSVHIV